MPLNPKYFAKFVPGEYYHVFNRTNGSHKLFRDDENYKFFLNKYEEYLSDFVDTYCFCLLPSHFHLLVKVKEEIGGNMPIYDSIAGQELTTIDISAQIDKLVVKRFKNFFISYTMSFNKYHKRQGSLFNHRFKRILIQSDQHLRQAVFYIHANPVHHALTNSFITYRWSSYQALISGGTTKLKRSAVLDWFDGKDGFIIHHQLQKPTVDIDLEE